MTLEVAIKIIEDNANSTNNSLMDFTHERSKFNEIAFWEFYNAIRKIVNESFHEKNLSRDLTMKIVKPYEHFLRQIGFHFDKNDLYEMENIPEDFGSYSFRLRTVIDAYIIGEKIDDQEEDTLNSELKNILTIKLDK